MKHARLAYAYAHFVSTTSNSTDAQTSLRLLTSLELATAGVGLRMLQWPCFAKVTADHPMPTPVLLRWRLFELRCLELPDFRGRPTDQW